ncbi:hypothetical protein [uncultured Campylobacter sp.]|uniref:hypothetical protein n=1 Tax=uncultured Campylobacter sp. TaxID=218934 RepID=UPI00261392B3|nr:hypothetical protein [uncultured Campylobacter sp.]
MKNTAFITGATSATVIQYTARHFATAWARKIRFCEQIDCELCGRDHRLPLSSRAVGAAVRRRPPAA